MDQDSTFMSSLMTYLLNKFNIKIRTVVPYNHPSLQSEHGIKSLSNILPKHPDIKVSGTFREYYDFLNKSIKYLQDVLFNFKSKRLAMINKDRAFYQYKNGDLVSIISPVTYQLHTVSWKVTIKYVWSCSNI